jgi:amino acid adenylation domain-containing protein/non-ribosomal peptide synthase protein (TIGR01720 family)
MLPMRFLLNPDESAEENLKSIDRMHKKFLSHHRYPYNHLIKQINLMGQGHESLYTACINNYNTKMLGTINDVKLIPTELFNEEQVYGMQLVVRHWDEEEGIDLDIDYKIQEYDELKIDSFFEGYCHIIQQVMKEAGILIHSLELLSEQEKKLQLSTFNRTWLVVEREMTVLDMIQEKIKRYGDRVALEYGSQRLTYSELDELVKKCAMNLASLNVEMVGVIAKPSMGAVTAILGILSAGAAYLPIDPDYPEKRIESILKNAGIKMLLTEKTMPIGIGYQGQKMTIKELLNQSVAHKQNIERRINMEALAYVIFTSGTSGNPKGVMISHRALANYIVWAKKQYRKEYHEVMALFSSLAFDLTITSIFVPLASGNKIIIYGEDAGIHSIKQIVQDNKCTVLKLTPAHLSLIENDITTDTKLHTLIVGGDALKSSLAQNVVKNSGGKIRLFNEYGPTEATVGCMIYQYSIEDKGSTVPIGHAIDHVRIYLLDDEQKLLPKGCQGEIYIAGRGLSKGYFNNELQTNRVFFNDPFFIGEKMYRTGDIGIFVANDTINYLGRKDNQCKVRGYRVELAEIEEVIGQMWEVKEVVVKLCQNEHNGNFLCAYYVTDSELTDKAFRTFLEEILPQYMIPQYFIELEAIPYTINGKIDYDQLRVPVLNNHFDHKDDMSKEERMLCDVIAEVLKMEAVSLKDNFFHLAGDSIKAIQISSRLSELSYQLSIKNIMKNPDLHEMVNYMTNHTFTNAETGEIEGEIENTPIISWFFQQQFKNINYYHQCVIAQLQEDYDAELLSSVMKYLVKHHDMLRANYNLDKERLFYTKMEKFCFEEMLHHIRSEEDCDIIELVRKIGAVINLEHGPLFRVIIIQTKESGYRIGFLAHHLIVDGVSWRILMDDIETLAEQFKRKQTLSLPIKTSSYQKFSKQQKKFIKNVEAEIPYWSEQLNSKFSLGTPKYLQSSHSNDTDPPVRRVGTEETDQLLHDGNKPYHTKMVELLLLAWLRAIRDCLQQEDIVVELEGHGRDTLESELDVSRTVGWFTCLYPFRYVFQTDDLKEQIITLKEAYRQVPNNGFGYGLLLNKGMLKFQNEMKIRFNYLGEITKQSDGMMDHDLKSIQLIKDADNHETSWIEFNGYVSQNELVYQISYKYPEIKEMKCKDLSSEFEKNITIILKHCIGNEDISFTPSDFQLAQLSQNELESLFE